MSISVTNLSKVYGTPLNRVHALDGVTLTIPRGMFGLLGPNGAGKTTLMRILAGILRPTSGQVRVGNHDAATEAGRTSIKRMLGYLPQELGVYPDLSAREFLDYIGILKGMDDAQVRRRGVDDLLDMVGLANVANRKLKTYSGGMKRRVGIAQALLNDPRLLIVDEPTAGLDPEERIRFRNVLADAATERTVILSTHILEDIAQTAQRMAVLHDGRILFDGATPSLIEAARGKVWTVVTPLRGRPTSDATVVSTLHLGSSIQYRIVGSPPEDGQAVPAEPSLEDGYIWLMRTRRGAGDRAR